MLMLTALPVGVAVAVPVGMVWLLGRDFDGATQAFSQPANKPFGSRMVGIADRAFDFELEGAVG